MRKKDSRDIAISAITAFRKRNAWSDGFLRNEIRKNQLDPRDAALATEITNGVLQNMLLLNYYISKFSSVKLNKIAPGILDILQMAVYQILFLDRVPDSAVVNDAVNRAKRNNPRVAGFVNAITRRISAQKESLPKIAGSNAEILSIKHSHPQWLVNKLVEIYGALDAEKILISNNEKAKASARVNTLKTTTEKLLDTEKDFEKGKIDDSVFINFSGNIEKKDTYAKGLFYIQDFASQIASKTLNPLPGSKVLDACSAPGGKSFLLAQLMKNNGSILSCDIHEHKLELIKNGADRLGISIIKTVLSDASVFNPEFEKSFDYILADVPCSGIGIIRKKPDIRYKSEEEISGLPELQLKILNNLSRYLKHGGIFLYSTCTILTQENSEVIKDFLKENSEFEEVNDYTDIPHIKNDYGITLLPHISETDGFYMCKLRRQK